MRTSPSITCNWKKKYVCHGEHQKKSQNYVTSNRFKRDKFFSVCGLNLKLSSYRSLLSRKAELPDGITLIAYLWHFLHISRTRKRLDGTSEPKEPVTTWHFRSLLLSHPRPPSVHVYSWGILSKPPRNLLHSQHGYHMAHLSGKTPVSSVSNYTSNTLLIPPALSFCLIKQCKDKLSIHIKFIHYSDILFLGCLLMKQTHTNPYNNH